MQRKGLPDVVQRIDLNLHHLRLELSQLVPENEAEQMQSSHADRHVRQQSLWIWICRADVRFILVFQVA